MYNFQKFIKESGEELPRFLEVIDYSFERINQLPQEFFTIVAKSYYQLNRLGQAYLENAPSDKDFHAANALQTAAHAKAIEEMTGEKVDSSYIVRFGRRNPEYEAKVVTDVETEFTAFKGALDLWIEVDPILCTVVRPS